MKRQCVVSPFVPMTRYLFAVGVVLLSSLPCVAQAPNSDAFTFFQNSGQLASFLIPEDDPTLDGGGPIGLGSSGGFSPLPDMTQYGNYTVLTEGNGTISDVFGVVNFSGTFFIGFQSDPEGGIASVSSTFVNPNGGTPTTMPEGSGGPFDATKYLSSAQRGQGITATFQSDPAVPEPSTLTLLGLGSLGLVGYAWRRRKQPV
jgi:hypothetical protein